MGHGQLVKQKQRVGGVMMRGRALGPLPPGPSDGVPWDQGPRTAAGFDPRSPSLVRALERNRDAFPENYRSPAPPAVTCPVCGSTDNTADLGDGRLWCGDCIELRRLDESLTLFASTG